MISSKFTLGIDIGSVSVKFAVVDQDQRIITTRYQRMKGEPLATVIALFKDLLKEYRPGDFQRMYVMGTGSELITEALHIDRINEIVAQTAATAHFHPQVKTVIEIGGEDSKLIITGDNPGEIADFSMNSACAAGTGSFLDQQAARLGISIEDEFGKLALKSKNPPRIAGRCSVFAKSDMIHLQQVATPDYDIVAGLCFAMARNFKSTLGRAKNFDKQIAFQGGVAANKGMVRAFEETLDLEAGELIIPEHFACMGAIGAALVGMNTKTGSDDWKFAGIEPLEKEQRETIKKGPEPLGFFRNKARKEEKSESIQEVKPGTKAYLGIDIGSISTNVVVMDEDKNILSKRYLMTAGRPIEAVRRGIFEVGEEVGSKVEIMGVGTTGSGRYLIGDFVGADIVKNEITAQATAAMSLDPEVDTIFEIGGQDSKYISIDNGAIVDFEMNKVCAAGTGSFLEEQAEKLGINIRQEFGDLALNAKAPVPLGERCTVFMESDLHHQQQLGAPKDDLVAGLSYSIVHNYLNRVVSDRRIGGKIFFQGGVAANRGVVAAFEKVVAREILVPPHHEVTGAYGSAILARKHRDWEKSKFKGWDLTKRKYSMESFECKDCSNVCEVRKVVVENEEPLYYGSRCEKYDVKKGVRKNKELPQLFKEREQLLLNTSKPELGKDSQVVGIPRSLFFHEFYPFWQAFFGELGFRLIPSAKSNKTLINKGLEFITSETCFPIKVTYGHVLNLLERKVDYLFLPSIMNMSSGKTRGTRNFNCPYVQTIPYLIRSGLDIESYGVKVLQPVIDSTRGKSRFEKSLVKMGRELGVKPGRVLAAIVTAKESQRRFADAIQKRGKEIITDLRDNDQAVVVVSRPYNGCDDILNMALPKKLGNLGFIAIPMDFLPLDSSHEYSDWPNMYWRYGKRILRAADIINDNDRLNAIYITNFGCGPDSFISHFFRKKMSGKPYLQLEVDEHSADAGAITRCEAFQDSLGNVKRLNKNIIDRIEGAFAPPQGSSQRVVYINHMSDHAFGIKAAFIHHGVKAEVLPESDEETLLWGRRYTSGKECFPCIVTTGDIVKFIKRKDFNPDTTAFFMPSGDGPCRFGQYNTLQRMILNELGYEDVPLCAPNQDKNFYKEFGMLGSGFTRRLWNGILAVDILEKLLREIRPYELEKGLTDRVYKESLEMVTHGVIDDNLLETLVMVRDKFMRIPKDQSAQKPVIGVVGEIFVRASIFSNNDLAREIERLGGEAWFPPVAEWFLYLSHLAKLEHKTHKNYSGLLSTTVSEFIQKRDEHKQYKIFEGMLRNSHEPTIKQTLKLSDPYIHSSFEGEAPLSVGKSIDFFHKGMAGIVNAMPFSCMPGNIVNATLTRFRQDHGNIPYINMSYDGQGESNYKTRLEAFMHQAQRFHRERHRSGRPPQKPGISPNNSGIIAKQTICC
ncbi:MAG: acyl-CoA dehydratase activase [bacterium]